MTKRFGGLAKIVGLAVITAATSGIAYGEMPERILRDDGRSRGNPEASILLIEFSTFDQECYFCVKHFRETWPRIERKYVSTGKVRYLYREYPMGKSSHLEVARKASIAASCAAAAGKFAPMQDALIANVSKLDDQVIKSIALNIFPRESFWFACYTEQKPRLELDRDRLDGQEVGFYGVPGFVVYDTRSKEVIAVPGAFHFEMFEEELDRLLDR